jgi:hypothetical protein
MKGFTLTAGALAVALAMPVQADVINNLTLSVLPNPVPQSISNPCVICATQAQNPVGFGFNNFDSQGNDSSFNLFSSAITGAFANDDDVTVTPYLSSFLRAFLIGILDPTLTFGIAIDINTASGGETLLKFQLIDLDLPIGQKVIFDYTGPTALPDINNGNGKGDYLLTGFDLSNVSLGDHLLFRAQWSGASDGGESFYIVPILQVEPPVVPEPGSLALMSLALVGVAGFAASRRRKQ